MPGLTARAHMFNGSRSAAPIARAVANAKACRECQQHPGSRTCRSRTRRTCVPPIGTYAELAENVQKVRGLAPSVPFEPVGEDGNSRIGDPHRLDSRQPRQPWHPSFSQDDGRGGVTVHQPQVGSDDRDGDETRRWPPDDRFYDVPRVRSALTWRRPCRLRRLRSPPGRESTDVARRRAIPHRVVGRGPMNPPGRRWQNGVEEPAAGVRSTTAQRSVVVVPEPAGHRCSRQPDVQHGLVG